MTFSLPAEDLEAIIADALYEDVGRGDITTGLLVSPGLLGRATLLVKEEGILAGGEVAGQVFQYADAGLGFELVLADGSRVRAGDKIACVKGCVSSMLQAERTALNFLQRMSGIATLTAKFVAQVEGTRAMIVDTRKTTPMLRSLEKYAVLMGGGRNHRLNLAGGVLIKDNHLAALRSQGIGLKEAVRRARAGAPITLKVEVEVCSVPDALEAVEAGADIVMLDNMGVEDMKEAVRRISGRVEVEASGGVTLDNVRQVAMTGVDIISVGALTHSCRALDISLEFDTDSFKSG